MLGIASLAKQCSCISGEGSSAGHAPAVCWACASECIGSAIAEPIAIRSGGLALLHRIEAMHHCFSGGHACHPGSAWPAELSPPLRGQHCLANEAMLGRASVGQPLDLRSADLTDAMLSAAEPTA